MKKIILLLAKPIIRLAMDSLLELILSEVNTKMSKPYSEFTDSFIEFNKERWKEEITTKIFK